MVSPTNGANEKVAHACVKAKHRFGTDPNQRDYDILLLESKYAAVQSAETEIVVIKPIQAEDDLVDRLKIKCYVMRILEEVDDMEADPKTAKLVPTVFKGLNDEIRTRFDLEARFREWYSKINERAIIDRVIYWRKIRVIICTTDFAIIHLCIMMYQ